MKNFRVGVDDWDELATYIACFAGTLYGEPCEEPDEPAFARFARRSGEGTVSAASRPASVPAPPRS